MRTHKSGSSERFLAERGINLPAGIVDPATELMDLAQRYDVAVQVSRLALLKSRLNDLLLEEYPEAELRFNLDRLEGLGYYTGLTLRITPTATDGVRYPIVDGGFTDWTARLLQDNKERLMTSGIGSELVCRRFRAG